MDAGWIGLDDNILKPHWENVDDKEEKGRFRVRGGDGDGKGVRREIHGWR